MLPDLGQQSLCWDRLLADEATVLANRGDERRGNACSQFGKLKLNRFPPTGRVRIKYTRMV